MLVLQAYNVTVEAGDMLCLHTKFAQRVLLGTCCVLNGRDRRLD